MEPSPRFPIGEASRELAGRLEAYVRAVVSRAEAPLPGPDGPFQNGDWLTAHALNTLLATLLALLAGMERRLRKLEGQVRALESRMGPPDAHLRRRLPNRG